MQQQDNINGNFDRPSKYEQLKDLLEAYSTWIGLTLIIVAGGLIFGLVDLPKIKLDTLDWVIITSYIGGMVLVGPFIYMVIKRLRTTPKEFIVKTNATHDRILNAWAAHPRIVQRVDVVDGQAYQTNTPGGIAHIVREFDPEQLTAKGVWLGEANDIEILTAQQKIEANRGNLRDWAMIGQNLYSKLQSIAQGVEAAYWRAMADEELEEEALHPDVVRSNMVEEVDKLTESIETPMDDDSETDAEEVVDEVLDEEGIDIPDEDALTGGEDA